MDVTLADEPQMAVVLGGGRTIGDEEVLEAVRIVLNGRFGNGRRGTSAFLFAPLQILRPGTLLQKTAFCGIMVKITER